MKTLKSNPALMTVIINIQSMREVIFDYYNRREDFKNISGMTEEELYELQDTLIPLYNTALKNKIKYNDYS